MEPPTVFKMDEIIKSDSFINRLRKNANELMSKRRFRPEARQGFYYKRDWYDRMSSDGFANAQFFVDNFESVLKKQSKLSSETRHIIRYVADATIREELQRLMNPNPPQ